MVILFINNDGARFADHVTIADGTTVEQLFAQRVPQGKQAITSSASIANRCRPGKSSRKATA